MSSKEEAVADAQHAYDQAASTFCENTKNYITAIDRYGKVFDDSAATVGDIETAGADLAKPRDTVRDGADAVKSARGALAAAQQDLAEAQIALVAANAEASGSSSSGPAPAPASTTTTTLVPVGTVDRIEKAEADLSAAKQGITDETPLARATAEYNAAAFALEAAWLRVLSDAGCLTDEQQQEAERALSEYTASLQTALQTAGYYTGPVDGVYGSSTVEAVKKLQTANGLSVTGYVDEATEVALNSALAAKGGAVATDALTHTASVQSTLKLAGYWTGAVDGKWTPELTDALKKFQTDLGVPPTGAVDTATLAALNTRIADSETSTSASTTTSTAAPDTPSSTTTAP